MAFMTVSSVPGPASSGSFAPTVGRVAGAVLAGGCSSRMGATKAFALLAGRPLLAHVLDRLRPQTARSLPQRPRQFGSLAGVRLPSRRGRAGMARRRPFGRHRRRFDARRGRRVRVARDRALRRAVPAARSRGQARGADRLRRSGGRRGRPRRVGAAVRALAGGGGGADRGGAGGAAPVQAGSCRRWAPPE